MRPRFVASVDAEDIRDTLETYRLPAKFLTSTACAAGVQHFEPISLIPLLLQCVQDDRISKSVYYRHLSANAAVMIPAIYRMGVFFLQCVLILLSTL